jgi:hypothetical protein
LRRSPKSKILLIIVYSNATWPCMKRRHPAGSAELNHHGPSRLRASTHLEWHPRSPEHINHSNELPDRVLLSGSHSIAAQQCSVVIGWAMAPSGTTPRALLYVCRRLHLGRIRKDIDNFRSNLRTLQYTHG